MSRSYAISTILTVHSSSFGTLNRLQYWIGTALPTRPTPHTQGARSRGGSAVSKAGLSRPWKIGHETAAIPHRGGKARRANRRSHETFGEEKASAESRNQVKTNA